MRLPVCDGVMVRIERREGRHSKNPEALELQEILPRLQEMHGDLRQTQVSKHNSK
jgi:hypothetical protein